MQILVGLSKKSHVITFDYRGFGNSSKAIPTEQTLRIDAHSVYNYVIRKGVDPSRIVLVGHSLGSGVATDLAFNLARDKVPCRGLVLVSGYASIADAGNVVFFT